MARTDVDRLVVLMALYDCWRLERSGEILSLAPKSTVTLATIVLFAPNSSVALGANVVGSDNVVGVPRDKTVIAKSTSVLVHAPLGPKGLRNKNKRCYSLGSRHGLIIDIVVFVFAITLTCACGECADHGCMCVLDMSMVEMRVFWVIGWVGVTKRGKF